MAADRIYHHRVRDGQVVLWWSEGGRLGLLLGADQPTSPANVAALVLADAIGWEQAKRGGGWAALKLCDLARSGQPWDVTRAAVRHWAARS